MLRTVVLGAALALAALPAAAQSWGFGVEVGPPVYYDEPQVYYGPPVVYEQPPVYYDAPAVVGPEPRVFHMEAPELVLERLENAGYRELSPMARRGTLYRLNAVDPQGNLVALEISIFTGEIERTRILEARYQAPARAVAAPRPVTVEVAPPRVSRPAPVPAAAPPPSAAASTDPAVPLRDRLKTPPTAAPDEDRDPLVVY
jgi:hypothetical protein